MVPEVWNKAIIALIPKGANKKPYLPLSHRGISLVSCIYIVFTGVLNNRMTGFTEDMNAMYDEQNRFSKSRSRRDHIFGLLSNLTSTRFPTKELVSGTNYPTIFDV